MMINGNENGGIVVEIGGSVISESGYM